MFSCFFYKKNFDRDSVVTHVRLVYWANGKGKGEGKKVFMRLPMSQKRLNMARVVKESHSFTCHPHVYPRTE